MEATHQKKVVEAMLQPDFYPYPVDKIEQRETHISRVFLTGSLVYKIKKPLNLEFLDCTTIEKRERDCRREVTLNRRLAKNVYLGVSPITFDGQQYFLEGKGRVVEYAVKMRQLPEERAMPVLIKKHRIHNIELKKLAKCLSDFYEHAETNGHITTVGSWETVVKNCNENFHQIAPFADRLPDAQMLRIIQAATRAFLNRKKALFIRRADQGKIRDCHGDLRAEHVYFIDGVQIIDCIEFNERFRYADVAADLAFLAMDLDFLECPEIAKQLLDGYVRCSRDWEVYVLLDFYKCYRAVVRGKINIFRLQDSSLDKKEQKVIRARIQKFLLLAYEYAKQFTRPAIWVICGLSGSGKSTISAELSGALGIPIVSTDKLRKQLFGLKADAKRDIPFETGIYTKTATALTYGQMLLNAQDKIKEGRSVILDATFSTRDLRREVIRLADDLDANLLFIECWAPDRLLRERLGNRAIGATSSDARLHHFKELKNRYESLDDIAERIHIRVQTGNPLADVMKKILAHDHVVDGKIL